MFSGIRRRFTFANVVMTLALVFAMTGGAFAASKLIITSTKQISPKVLKALKGANGTNGTNGASGAAGSAGPQGAQGPQGPQGPQGAQGAQGEKGKDGTAGKDGATGKEGSPWTAGGTLPSGKTETGTWSFSEPEGLNEGPIFTSISFAIPLAPSKEAALDENHTFYIGFLELFKKEESKQTHEACPSEPPKNFGTGEEPLVEAKAAPGFLCVYEGQYSLGGSTIGVTQAGSKAEAAINLPSRPEGFHGAGSEGAVLRFKAEGSGQHWGAGVWAVTAE